MRHRSLHRRLLGTRGPAGAAASSMAALAAAALAAAACAQEAAPREEREPYAVAFARLLDGSDSGQLRDVCFDGRGNAYVAGGTSSRDFPRTLGPAHAGESDVVIAKLDPAGEVVWARLLGGPGHDRAYAIELDPAGNVVIGGRAGTGFPTTAGALQPGFGGDAEPVKAYGPQDAFAAKLSPDGERVLWATYFGADDGAFFRDVDVDREGNVYGAMCFGTKPLRHVTPGAFCEEMPGAPFGVVVKIAADGSRVLWATYLGGRGDGFALGTPSIRVDGEGAVVVAGHAASPSLPTTEGAYDRIRDGKSDLHVAKLAPDGSRLVFATYLGGSDIEYGDTHNLALRADGAIVVAATTKSPDFPTTPGAFQTTYGGSGGGYNQQGDGFVAILSADGSRLVASTFVGGSSGEGIEGVALDAQGSLLVSGGTYSRDLPGASGPALAAAERPEAFVAKLAPDLGRLEHARYLGGSGWDLGLAIAAGPGGAFCVVGESKSRDFPATGPKGGIAGEKSGMIARFEPRASAAPQDR